MSIGATDSAAAGRAGAAARSARLGVVSFLNALPLIDGLERLADVELRQTVPSRLIDMLLRDEVDAALCSSIDYQRSPEPLAALPCGVLGCDGATLTVRLYASQPIERTEQVHCDTDSHTSVVLMRILMRERYNIDPGIVDHDVTAVGVRGRVAWPPAVLLIGDKVVTDSPPRDRYPYQLDLGELWRWWTGFPFVFALWLARPASGRGPASRVPMAAAVLDRQRRHNRLRLDRIVHQQAAVRHWPVDLARDYLTQHLSYEIDERMLAGLELFFQKAYEHGLTPNRRAIEWG